MGGQNGQVCWLGARILFGQHRRIATFGQNKPEINDWSKAMRGKPKKTFF
jgi:hypothetical protein